LSKVERWDSKAVFRTTFHVRGYTVKAMDFYSMSHDRSSIKYTPQLLQKNGAGQAKR